MSRFFAIALLCAFLAGCSESGPAMGTVSGIVTLDGKPMPGLQVTFSPKEGGSPAVGKTNSDGEYELLSLNRKGAVVGLHEVKIKTVIEPTNPNRNAGPTESGGDDYMNQGSVANYKAAERNQQKELIPKRYNENTELVEEVTTGANEINFDLKSK